ncbi:6-carboxytetrahydropterin synthase QueD [bacterium]|nr:6-carboxytetrahydropterin synthase QueD [bacterium]
MSEPIFQIKKSFRFNSAHYLPGAPDGHKCRNLHGHTYEVVIECRGTMDIEAGWVIDFGDISDIMRPLIKQLDHVVLNELEGLKYTTAEELCYWIWERTKPKLPSLISVVVHETPTSCAEYRGEVI